MDDQIDLIAFHIAAKAIQRANLLQITGGDLLKLSDAIVDVIKENKYFDEGKELNYLKETRENKEILKKLKEQLALIAKLIP